MSCLPKPVLRGHTRRSGIKLLVSSICSAVIVGASYHYFCGVPRRRGYVEFLKNYDPQAHMKDLIAWGYMKGPITLKEKVKEAMEN